MAVIVSIVPNIKDGLAALSSVKDSTGHIFQHASKSHISHAAENIVTLANSALSLVRSQLSTAQIIVNGSRQMGNVTPLHIISPLALGSLGIVAALIEGLLEIKHMFTGRKFISQFGCLEFQELDKITSSASSLEKKTAKRCKIYRQILNDLKTHKNPHENIAGLEKALLTKHVDESSFIPSFFYTSNPLTTEISSLEFEEKLKKIKIIESLKELESTYIRLNSSDQALIEKKIANKPHFTKKEKKAFRKELENHALEKKQRKLIARVGEYQAKKLQEEIPSLLIHPSWFGGSYEVTNPVEAEELLEQTAIQAKKLIAVHAVYLLGAILVALSFAVGAIFFAPFFLPVFVGIIGSVTYLYGYLLKSDWMSKEAVEFSLANGCREGLIKPINQGMAWVKEKKDSFFTK